MHKEMFDFFLEVLLKENQASVRCQAEVMLVTLLMNHRQYIPQVLTILEQVNVNNCPLRGNGSGMSLLPGLQCACIKRDTETNLQMLKSNVCVSISLMNPQPPASKPLAALGLK